MDCSVKKISRQRTFYLKCDFEDGLVYFKIDPVSATPENDVFEGEELIFEEDAWQKDRYELWQQDIDEMIDDGFFEIDEAEYQEALAESGQ